MLRLVVLVSQPVQKLYGQASPIESCTGEPAFLEVVLASQPFWKLYGRAGGSPPMKRSHTMRRRNSLRLRNYDYTQGGVYFVTICAYRFAHLFGQIVQGNMQLNDLGRLVDQEWTKTASVRTHVEVDMYVIMPNHIHGILMISSSERTLHPPGAVGLPANSLGAIISQFKSIVTKRSRKKRRPPQFGSGTTTIALYIASEPWSRSAATLSPIPSRWEDDEFYGEWL